MSCAAGEVPAIVNVGEGKVSLDNRLLEVENLAIAPAGTALLEDISFKLLPGEMLALSGPSGCGKSSLLRVIAGLDDAAGGYIRHRGLSPDDIGLPRFRRKVVYVHQRPVMLDSSVEENLRRPLRHRAVDLQFDRYLAGGLLKELELNSGLLDQSARSLSIGEQQRVSMVRALLVQPEVLLLDEPTSALDEVSRSAVETLLKRICAEREMAAVVVTHDRQQAERLCGVVYDLKPHYVGPTTQGDQGDG